jgi:hypothetical protein
LISAGSLPLPQPSIRVCVGVKPQHRNFGCNVLVSRESFSGSDIIKDSYIIAHEQMIRQELAKFIKRIPLEAAIAP